MDAEARGLVHVTLTEHQRLFLLACMHSMMEVTETKSVLRDARIVARKLERAALTPEPPRG